MFSKTLRYVRALLLGMLGLLSATAFALTPPPIVVIPIYVGTSGCPALPTVATPVYRDTWVDLSISFCATAPASGTLIFTSSDARAVLPAPAPYNALTLRPEAQSAGSVTFRTPGIQTLTARDAANPAVSWTITVNVSPVSALLGVDCVTLAIALVPPLVFTQAAQPITVSNCGAAVTPVLTFSATDPLAVLPPPRAFSAGPNFGEPAGNVIFNTPGIQTLYLRDPSGALVSQFTFEILANGGASLSQSVPVNNAIALVMLIAVLGLAGVAQTRRRRG